jgi:hypothetical protein
MRPVIKSKKQRYSMRGLRKEYTTMSNSNWQSEIIECPPDADYLEYSDESWEYELRQLKLASKVESATRRFILELNIPFCATYFFSLSFRPFVEEWDDVETETVECPSDSSSDPADYDD